MSWQLAISFSILASITTSLIQRRYSQRSLAPASIPPAVSYLLGVCPLGIILGLILPHHVIWSWWVVVLITLNGIIMALANWIGFVAVKRLPVARFQTINQFYVIVVIILGWTILHEGLGRYQLAGAGLLFLAALLAIRAPQHISHEHRRTHIRSVVLALSAATTLGTALVIEKATLGHMDVGAYLIFGYSAQTLAMLLLAAKDVNRESLRNFSRSEIKWSAGMGVANGITGLFYVLAIVGADNISQVTAVASITLPLLALAAYVILKEREQQRLLWAGLVLGFLGLLVSGLH